MNFSHHAYLIEGDLEKNRQNLCVEIEKLIGGELSKYPDYFQSVQSNFTVADSELFISKQSTMSFGGGKRFFVLSGEAFTTEAQNKLLKVLEEPLADNHIFIFAPKAEVLLPTLLSRLFVVRGDQSLAEDVAVFCEKFTESSLTDRMVMIEKFLKANDDDESAKLRHKTKEIFAQMENMFADSIIRMPDSSISDVSRFLTELLEVKKYLDDSSPSIKMILEYVAFICPSKF